jgi:hypothetical protein
VSVMVRIVLYPPDGGSLVIKSSAIVLNGQAFSIGEMGNRGGVSWVAIDF